MRWRAALSITVTSVRFVRIYAGHAQRRVHHMLTNMHIAPHVKRPAKPVQLHVTNMPVSVIFKKVQMLTQSDGSRYARNVQSIQ